MERRPRILLGVVAAIAATVGTFAAVRAETWNLELKRLPPRDRAAAYSASDFAYQYTEPQSFFCAIPTPGAGKKGRQIRFGGDEAQMAEFKRIVKKEPKYAFAHPFRGVAHLGSQEFAFALDYVAEQPAAKGTKETKKAAKPPAKDVPSPEVFVYNRLYFDFNRNGDLTDDKVIAGETSARYRSSFATFGFPQLDVPIDVEGTKVDYAFRLSGYVNCSEEFSYASVSLNAAVYREGDVVLEGKKHRVVLIDFNSNGRFDDQTKLSPERQTPEGRIYPEQGDMLLWDFAIHKPGDNDWPYDLTSNHYQQLVSKVVCLDGRYYDLKISPAGDKLTLTPSSIPPGRVTNPNRNFRAVVYGEHGFLVISSRDGAPVWLPEGQWKLLSYTIDGSEPPKTDRPAKEPERKEESSLLRLLIGAVLGGPRRGPTIVTAAATGGYEAVSVRRGETVAIPFGPPYTPVVTAAPLGDRKQLSLGMELVGSAGEVCSNLMVHGDRPAKPAFTIIGPKKETVDTGNFEYG